MMTNRPGPKLHQHPTERLVAAIKEQFKRDVERYKQFLTVNGRPVFHVKLTEDEELARFRDPQMRQLIMADIERREGPEAVGRYVSRMYRAMGRQEQRDLTKWQSSS